jgi:xanthine dehydrogenase accessory factor
MKELKQIISRYEDLKSDQAQCALATVVSVEGSSYRKAGARMLIAHDGGLTGAISGGCLEGDALKKALLVMSENQAQVVTYDTMDDDDATLGFGLGCNGIIKVLIEPIDYSDELNAIELIKQIFAKRRPSRIMTIFQSDYKRLPNVGTQAFADEDSFFVKDDFWKTPMYGIQISSTQNEWITLSIGGENYTVFSQYLPPPTTLVIVGAGNDVLPLVGLADILGWEVVVIDGRVNYLKADRFSPTCTLYHAKPEEVLAKVHIDEYTFFTLMTHNYLYDKSLIEQLIKQSNLKYLGMIGAKRKWERMLEEFEAEGISFTAKELDKIYSPVGLNLGASTSEEIALCVVAEIQSIIYGNELIHLRSNRKKL